MIFALYSSIYFFGGATFSLNNLPAEKAGTSVAGICILSPVLGLRPSLAFLRQSNPCGFWFF